jgi:hypothetical protein
MTQDEIKALIEDLRLNHEFCPKEVILQAADELERMQGTPPAPQPVPVKTYSGGKPWPVAPKPWVGLDGEIPGLGLVTEEFYNGMIFAEDILRERNT